MTFYAAIVNFFNSVLQLIPDLLLAAIFIVIAIVVAGLAKKVVLKLLKACKIEKFLSKIGVKAENTENVISFIGKLVYFVVVLLFVPGILDNLGLSSVANPITNMISTFIAFIPKLVAAGLVLAIGIFLAKLVKDILKPVLNVLKVDKLQEKLGIKTNDKFTFSNIIVNIIYGLIVLVVVASALDQIGLDVISNPVNSIVASIFGIVPNILAAIVVIAIGVFIANLVANLLCGLLVSVGADSLIEKITGNSESKLSISKICSTVVKYVIAVIFVVEGIQAIGLPILTTIGMAIIGYLPELLSVVLIVLAGVIVSKIVEKALVSKESACKACVALAKTCIYVVTAFLALNQLGIAPEIVNTTFVFIIAALCIAFAVAFGIGGRQFAANTLKKVEEKMDSKCDCNKEDK